MAHVLSITDGTTTIDLAETTDAGYHFIAFRTPRPNRLLTRVSGYPFRDGSRTTAAALDDTVAEIVLLIAGSSTDDVESKLTALARLLQAAQRWEVDHTGAPVRVLFKRQGATNTSYRVITGVPLMPEPVDPEEGDWLDISTVTNTIVVSFTLTMEPVAHAGALTTIKTATTVTNVAGSNTVTTNATTGNMNGPIVVSLERAAFPTNWTQIWMIEAQDAPIVDDWAGTVDAAAKGGQAQSVSASGTVTTLSGGTGGISTTWQYPLRGVVRAKVTAGTASKLQFRARIVTDSSEVVGPWVTYTGTSGSFYLTDLGTIGVLSDLTSLANNAAASYQTTTQVRTIDGSAVTVLVDYSEAIPYRSIAKLSGPALLNDFVYSHVYQMSTFVWPRRTPIAYGSDSGTTYTAAWQRAGELVPLLPNATQRLWFAMQTATVHVITNTADVTVQHLPCYALGLRGNA